MSKSQDCRKIKNFAFEKDILFPSNLKGFEYWERKKETNNFFMKGFLFHYTNDCYLD